MDVLHLTLRCCPTRLRSCEPGQAGNRAALSRSCGACRGAALRKVRGRMYAEGEQTPRLHNAHAL